MPDYYPLIRSDGYPFAHKSAFEHDRLKYTVELVPEKKGLIACYARFNPIGYGEENYEDFYEYYFGSNYRSRLKDFGKLIDLDIQDRDGRTQFKAIPVPAALPHFLITDQSVAEFVSFEFFGGGHVQ